MAEANGPAAANITLLNGQSGFSNANRTPPSFSVYSSYPNRFSANFDRSSSLIYDFELFVTDARSVPLSSKSSISVSEISASPKSSSLRSLTEKSIPKPFNILEIS